MPGLKAALLVLVFATLLMAACSGPDPRVMPQPLALAKCAGAP
ncbi:hypothetical protein [Alkalicaulis satelles]|nr:hypothetical protein [Alkalicaulis satelles]